ncbi:MAG TPA: FN3 associated domain-containing protein [Candidatus Acidoferrales bacterium]|jgi:hypothetical protein|nr:FN3 associated domain-containing protein [Candidatus Acidoferrales bacterium]
MRTKSPSLLRQTLLCWSGAMLALMLAGVSVQALPTVATLGGGSPFAPFNGYVDGDTHAAAKFNNPVGLAIDQSDNYLFVADRDNNAIRVLQFDIDFTATFTPVDTNGLVLTNLFIKPVGVTIDSEYNLFVLNRGNNNNGNVLQFDYQGTLVATNLAKITNANAIAEDDNTNLYVTAGSNVFKVSVTTGTKSLLATVKAPNALLKGITVKHNGLLAVCDYGRNGILLIDPVSGVITTNSGFHGQGDFANNVNDTSPANSAQYFSPSGIAETGDGTLIVSDLGNNRVKAVLASGVETNIYGVASTYWNLSYFPGWADGQVLIPDSKPPNVSSRLPNGVVFANDGSVYVSEDYYHLIRKVSGAGLALPPPPPVPPPAAPTGLTVVSTNFNTVTLRWQGSDGATNYFVKRSPSSGGPYAVIGSVPDTGAQTYTFTDTSAVNGFTNYYVVSAANAFGESSNSMEVGAVPPLPPVANPKIGYVDFPATSLPVAFTSVFHPVNSFIFNNDVLLVIVGEVGSQTFYNFAATPTNGTIPDPNSSSSSAPSGYQDGLLPSQVQPFSIGQPGPDITIKAIGEKSTSPPTPNSAITQARFQFITANPVISGNNAANFVISDITTGAHLYYTLDGSDPSATNPAATDLGVSLNSSNTWPVTFSLQSDTLFKIRATRANYQDSGIVSNVFLASNFQPTTISFGFGNGEGSSAFIASPGQTFYAPVTMTLAGTPTIYSLQFDLTVTNGVTNSGPPIAPGSFSFQSMLEKPIPGITPTVYEDIPPAMFAGGQPVPNPVILPDGSTGFSGLLITNTGLNLLGVAWFERFGATNLFDTTKQTLISFSQAHDIQFLAAGGKVIVGGYNVLIPASAQSNQTYQIQITRPTVTVDGVGASGSSLFIASPTNGGTGAGSVNALKYITVGQFRYLVGSTYPFRWFNAGDFGSSNLVSADVVQVFQSAIYGANNPPPGSDFFDAMDSSGNLGALDTDGADSNFGYYTNANPSGIGSTVIVNPLFDGNDTTINQDVFGDGFLDVSDVYVTLRRSLDPSLTWYRRFWNNNGQRVADTAANIPASKAGSGSTKAPGSLASKSSVSNAIPPLVNFSAGDVVGAAGQTVSVPISATIVGSYPLRVLMLNLTVTPLDGSPALTTGVSFSQTAAVLGAPYLTGSSSTGNYSAVWLNSTNTGLSNSVVIGNLNVKIPSNANSNSAYAIHFDHASASPNGLASFPNHVLTGILSTSSRTNSSYQDGIPDSWRLRWFGTVNNVLSVSNACPSGDGVDNWYKYIAGIDPNVAGDFPQTKTKSPGVLGYNYAIHWPSVNGKKYAIEGANTLFGGTWSAMATNTGTGNDMEFDDNTTNKVKFYRVRILP